MHASDVVEKDMSKDIVPKDRAEEAKQDMAQAEDHHQDTHAIHVEETIGGAIVLKEVRPGTARAKAKAREKAFTP